MKNNLRKQIKENLNEWFRADWDTALYYKEALDLHTDQLASLFSTTMREEKKKVIMETVKICRAYMEDNVYTSTEFTKAISDLKKVMEVTGE